MELFSDYYEIFELCVHLLPLLENYGKLNDQLIQHILLLCKSSKCFLLVEYDVFSKCAKELQPPDWVGPVQMYC